MELCRHLRWKGYDEALTRDEVLLAARRNSVPYRCLRTCQPWGVDDDLAAPENCVSGRPCFTPKTRRARSDARATASAAVASQPDVVHSAATEVNDDQGQAGELERR